MTMTLECDTEFPRALKDNMRSLDFEGEVVYKDFPFMDEGQEYWSVQVHLYRSKEADHKTEGDCMFTNPIHHTSFFDSARNAAWRAIKYLAERLRFRLQNNQKHLEELKEVEEELEALKKKID